MASVRYVRCKPKTDLLQLFFLKGEKKDSCSQQSGSDLVFSEIVSDCSTPSRRIEDFVL